jgi:hypothetical protein
MQPLKDHEYPLGVGRINTNAVITHSKSPVSLLPLHGNMYLRVGGPTEFHRIADEILEQLPQLHLISHERREWIVGHLCATFGASRLQTAEDTLQHLLTIGGGR